MNLKELLKNYPNGAVWCVTCPYTVVDQSKMEIAHSDLADKARVFVLRGKNMQTVSGFIDEFEGVLQFPSYFGRNGNALDECLNDLEWINASAYVLIIKDAACVLSSADLVNGFASFLDILEQACEEWGLPYMHGQSHQKSNVPFHVILQCTKEDEELLQKRYADTGRTTKPLVLG